MPDIEHKAKEVHLMRSTPENTARRSAAAEQADHSEHAGLELDRLTVALLAASDAAIHPREALRARLAAVKPRADLRGPLRACAAAIRCLVRPYVSDDAKINASARRLLVAAAAIIAATVTAARWRRRD